MRLLLPIIVFGLGINNFSVAATNYGLNRVERRLVRAIIKDKSPARVRSLAKQIDVNFTFKDFPSSGIAGTPLIIAAVLGTHGGNNELVTVLVEEGADANLAYDGETPLHHMFKVYRFVWGLKKAFYLRKDSTSHSKERLAMIEQLVNLGASLDVFNNKGETPFMYAIMGIGNYGIRTIELMLELGANPLLKKKDEDGKEYDIFAMRLPGERNNELSKFYRPQLRDLVNNKMQEWMLAQRTEQQKVLDNQLLQAVVDNASLVDVKQLLEQGAHPDRAVDNNNSTVLHIAARQGQLAKVNLLLEYQANVGLKDNNGNSSFDYGAQGETSDHWLIASILLEKLFNNIDARDNKGWTVLNWALASGDYQRVSELLANGADITLGTQDAFEIVEALQDQRMLDLLVEHYDSRRGGFYDEHHDSQVEAFIRAALNGLVWVGQQLINRGVDVNSVGVSGTALLKATIHEQLDFIRLLIANNVDISYVDRRGNNAASYARSELYRRQRHGQQPVGQMQDILELLENS